MKDAEEKSDKLQEYKKNMSNFLFKNGDSIVFEKVKYKSKL